EGVNGRFEQPVTCSGAVAVCEVLGASYESAVTLTLAGVAGQLVGIRTPFSVLFSSSTAICVPSAPSSEYEFGIPLKRTFNPTPAGSLDDRTVTSAGVPSW